MRQTQLREFDTWTSTTSVPQRYLGHCPCCEHKERSLWFQNRDLILHRCHRCGVAYQDPQPDLAALLKQSYSEEYFASCRERLPDQTTALQTRLADIERLAWADGTPHGPLRALDIGSGIGAFLLAARERGWQPAGLEPSPYAVRYCMDTLGLDVKQGTLDDHVAWPYPFDVVHLNHVLEHFQRPLENLQRVRQLLRPGGVLAVEVPREGKLASLLLHKLSAWRAATRYPRPVFTIVHMCVFTPASLHRLLERTGFSVERLWVEGNAASPERYRERFGDSPPLGKLLGRASQWCQADVWAGMGNIVAYARAPFRQVTTRSSS